MSAADSRGALGPDQTLAIVIPAHKARYLGATLESIARQTDRAFTVYIGDDASPSDLRRIVEPYRNRLSIQYTRFTSNLGGADLVAHWHRCVDLTSESWIWLFSDDDLMSDDCVAAFRSYLAHTPAPPDLLRFRVQEIDDAGVVLRPPLSLKSPLSSLEFCASRLRGEIPSYVPEHVFRRQTFVDCGGFPRFALAWCSDDAAWMRMGRNTGMHEIPSGVVSWRRSGLNITSARAELAPVKLRAATEYLRWLKTELSSYDAHAVNGEFSSLCRQWLIRHSRYLDTYFLRAGLLPCARNSAHLFRFGGLGALASLVQYDLKRLLAQSRARRKPGGGRRGGKRR